MHYRHWGILGLFSLSFKVCAANWACAICICDADRPRRWVVNEVGPVESKYRLSMSVALVGILAPIGLSLICFVFAFGATPLQGFTAGAASCSTSLGTTFAILSSFKSSSDLRNTRIGIVLLSAAILDDVVGLIMASVVSQVIAPENQMHGKRLAWTILQPLVASAGMVGGALVVVRWLLLPIYRKIILRTELLMSRRYLLLAMIVLLSGLVTISNFTGSSMLFGAYIAGCILQFLDSSTTRNSSSSFKDAFDAHVGPLNEHVFVPLFFSSIGSAIQFLPLWKGSVIWKGVVYALLMCVGKAATGICILAWPDQVRLEEPVTNHELNAETAPSTRIPLGEVVGSSTSQMQPQITSPSCNKKGLFAERQMPVYPALLISLAMISRGEIALLIAQLGLPTLGEDNFLVVMWAAVLCTLVGAVTTGQLVHKRFLEYTRGSWE